MREVEVIGTKTIISYRRCGQLHDEGSRPAYSEYENGKLTLQSQWLRGRLEGRTSRYDENGQQIYVGYYCKGLLHSTNGLPAVIEFVGKTKIEEYYTDGRIHNLKGPARTTYSDVGDIIKEEWFDRGLKSRKGAPAEIEYWPNGRVRRHVYFCDGIKHNPKGPTTIEFDERGTILA